MTEPDFGNPRPARGRVKWYSRTKQFGFITLDDGTEAFVHHQGIVWQSERGNCDHPRGICARELAEGEPVEFMLFDTVKGPEARSVRRLTDAV
jgi:CspA family cold shock protein